MRHHQIGTQTFKIITQYGDMHVVKQGVLHRHTGNSQNHHHSTNAHHHHHHYQHQQGGSISCSGGGGGSSSTSSDTQAGSRPILMTFHDLGMNSELQFANFCERDEVKLMLQTFTIIHVNFIGQEFNGQGQPVGPLPDDYKYPTVEQMAECIVDVCAQLRVRSFIGIAVGAGAHIVSTLALMRPDLVHGLFLINPVISSCSITEWLYFKMSAIASNHQILGGNHGGGHHAALGTGSSVTSSLSEDQSMADDHHHHSSSSSSGFKKLWRAVNNNHHGHHGHQRHHNQSIKSNESTHGSESGSESGSATPPSLSQTPSCSNMSQNQTAPPVATTKPAAAAAASSRRLRQLILSRNFRLGKQQQQQQQHEQQRPASAHTRDSSSLSSSATKEDDSGGSASAQGRRASAGSHASSTASSQMGYSGKRPPLEYMMYHHFGTASLQRFRRMSSDMQATSITGRRGHPAPQSPARAVPGDDSLEFQDKELAQQGGGQHRDSCDSNASVQSASRFAASAAAPRQDRGSRGSARGADSGSQRSQDSLTRSGSRNHRRLLHRSHSVSLEASYLASIASDRQRTAYMQNVYKRYFTQLNAHNLWLFAQSFVKRRTLNLRKDCGAAAHAAAAAAALGTSICAAFVGGLGGPVGGGGVGGGGVGGGGGGVGGAIATSPRGRASKDAPAAKLPASETREGEALEIEKSAAATKQGLEEEARASSERIQAKLASGLANTTRTTTRAVASNAAVSTGGCANKEQHPPRVLVAGTKVKRTFTCQTLIMCSSVHIHRERALKLMSLLNPLQATWIKTDQLLVLEEKPEKVCQALRLFLQGIGYSMSTYERRLRLGSAQASISSADSDGSARSLNLVSTAVAAADAGCPASPRQHKSVLVGGGGGGGGGGSASSLPFHQKTSM